MKNIFMMNEEGLSDLEKKAVIEGASELLHLANTKTKILDYGVFRASDRPHQSIDWFLDRGRKASTRPGQINCLEILNHLTFSKGDSLYYDILITKQDIYMDDTNFLIGVARPDDGTVISTYRFKNLNDTEKFECIKTETMHELGHVFGLPKEDRTTNVDYSIGLHCANRCIMRQGLIVPKDWLTLTYDRLNYGPLCPECNKDLKEYFSQ